jgi:predicted negative regulator of RcsB-dependent stress response
MDADTRHQLKSNELVEMLAGLKDLKKPQYLYPSIAVLAVLIGIVAWYGWRYSQRVAAAQDWQRLERIVASLGTGDPSAVSGAQSELRAMLQEKVQPGVRGYARIELARSRVEQGLAEPTERPEAFEEASRLLEEVLNDPAATDMQRAQATFLLASTCESLRQFDRAKELYQTLMQEPKYAGSPYRELAEKRLSNLDALSKPIAFTPGEAPPPPAPPAPTTRAVLSPDIMGPPAPPTEQLIPLTRMPQGSPPPPAAQPQPGPAPAPQLAPPAPQPGRPSPTPPPQPTPDTPPAQEPGPTP